MKSILVAIKDNCSGVFTPPALSPSTATAERLFYATLTGSEPGSMFSVYPKDFDMYLLGTFDDETGNINPELTPKLLFRGADKYQAS